MNWTKSLFVLICISMTLSSCRTVDSSADAKGHFQNKNLKMASIDGYVLDSSSPEEQKQIQDILQSLQKEKQQGLSVFWWNIMYGGMDKNYLDANLQKLIQSPLAPDILMFGEYTKDSLGAATLNQIRSRYSHERFVPYNMKYSHMGIQVFSTKKFVNIQADVGVLDWASLSGGQEAIDDVTKAWRKSDGKETVKWQRSFIRFSVVHQSKLIDIVPVHLCNPWVLWKKRYKSDYLSSENGVNRAAGTVGTGVSIMFSRQNPLVYQIKNLLSYLGEEYGAELNRKPFMMVGDFNMPRALGGVPPYGYGLLKEHLHPVMTSTVGTYPTASAIQGGNSYPAIHIDHSFVTKSVKEARSERLTFRGSDHYPVYTVLSGW